MHSWMILLGCQGIMMTICLVWCIRWMVSPKDEDDELLDIMAEKYKQEFLKKDANKEGGDKA